MNSVMGTMISRVVPLENPKDQIFSMTDHRRKKSMWPLRVDASLVAHDFLKSVILFIDLRYTLQTPGNISIHWDIGECPIDKMFSMMS